MSVSKNGFGLLGCGVIAPTHAEAIGLVEGAELLAVCDVSPVRAAQIAERFEVAAYTDVTAFLNHPGLEVVNVCVPSGLHAEVGVKVAQAGKHLLVEKPIEISLAAADRLIMECQQAGVKLGVISQHRFAPDVLKTKQAIEAGRLGPLLLGEAHIKWYRSQEYYDSGEWRGTWSLDGGGVLMNQGIHYIDLLLWLMGEVVSVKAFITTRTHQIEVEDVAIALVQFANGATGTITGTTSAYPGLPERLEIYGRDGTAIIETDQLTAFYMRDELGDPGRYGLSKDKLQSLTQSTIRPELIEATGPGGIGNNAHAWQIADFVAALREDRAPFITGQHARRPLALIKAIYQSARENREVFLSS